MGFENTNEARQRFKKILYPIESFVQPLTSFTRSKFHEIRCIASFAPLMHKRFHQQVGNSSIGILLDGLEQAISDHAARFYRDTGDMDITQYAIDRATSGIGIPWSTLRKLISTDATRTGAIKLCISWRLLSRCLLFQSGAKNVLGSALLPPEIVECFQSMNVVWSSGSSISQGNLQGKLPVLEKIWTMRLWLV